MVGKIKIKIDCLRFSPEERNNRYFNNVCSKVLYWHNVAWNVEIPIRFYESDSLLQRIILKSRKKVKIKGMVERQMEKELSIELLK